MTLCIFREKRYLIGYMYPNATAALFIIAKTWKQPKCASKINEERREKM